MLSQTKSPRGLARRLKVFGFEILDLILLCFVLTVLNFTFGPMGHRLFFVFIPTIVLATTLFFGKRGKPEKYLEHWIRFELAPKDLFAWHKNHQSSPAQKLMDSRRFK